MYKTIKVKWIVKGLPNIVIDENKTIWQLPFKSGPNNYSYRVIKEKLHQGQIKYRINGKWLSKKKINELAVHKEFDIVTNITLGPF